MGLFRKTPPPPPPTAAVFQELPPPVLDATSAAEAPASESPNEPVPSQLPRQRRSSRLGKLALRFVKNEKLHMVCAGLLAFLGLSALAIFGTQKIIEGKLRTHLASLTEVAEPYGEFHCRDLRVSLLRRGISLEGVDFQPRGKAEIIHVARVSIDQVDFQTIFDLVRTRKLAIPHHLHIGLFHLQAPAEILGDSTAVTWRELGYEDIQASLETYFSGDLRRGDVSLSETIELPKAGHLDVELSVDHLPPLTKADFARFKANPSAFTDTLPAFAALDLRKFSLSFEDASVTSRFTKFLQTHGENTPIELIDYALSDPGVRQVASDDFAHGSLLKLRAFFSNPGSLRLSSNPAQGIPLISVLAKSNSGSIDEIAKALKLKFESEAP